jgi:hypothetical protein
LFRRPDVIALFARVFRQACGRFVFEVRQLRLKDDRLTFYIMPADGFQLPEILKWIKQVFAQRFNGKAGRIGHIWGDRYESKILAGEPPEEGNNGVRPVYRVMARNQGFSLFFRHNPPLPPRLSAPRPG